MSARRWKEARGAPRAQRMSARLGFVFAMALAILLGGSSPVFACPVCFGAEETHMIEGTKLGVFVMLGITFAVQGALVCFFFYLRRRAKRIADLDLDTEWTELQRRTS
jgi:hypothetical protein